MPHNGDRSSTTSRKPDRRPRRKACRQGKECLPTMAAMRQQRNQVVVTSLKRRVLSGNAGAVMLASHDASVQQSEYEAADPTDGEQRMQQDDHPRMTFATQMKAEEEEPSQSG